MRLEPTYLEIVKVKDFTVDENIMPTTKRIRSAKLFAFDELCAKLPNKYRRTPIFQVGRGTVVSQQADLQEGLHLH